MMDTLTHGPLSATSLYERDTRPYRQALQLKHDHQQEVVQQAREGKQEAKEALILGLQDYVQFWARRFSRVYSWATPHTDYLELVSEGNQALLERFERALTKDHPRTYLASCAKYAIWNYCNRHATLIETPDKAKSHHMESLDVPWRNETDETVGAHLPAPPMHLSAEKSNEGGHEVGLLALTQGMEALTERQQHVLQRLYGLGERAPETPAQISRDYPYGKVGVHAIQIVRDQAHARLRMVLQDLPKDTSGNPAVYTAQQARRLLGVEGRHEFERVLKKHKIKPCAHHLYPRHPIDCLAGHVSA